jgi:hypothetical protein
MQIILDCISMRRVYRDLADAHPDPISSRGKRVLRLVQGLNETHGRAACPTQASAARLNSIIRLSS